jgi:sugar-specific transcriptional regulator TrmB
MYKKNASDIHESVEKNTNQVMTELREEIIGLLDEKNKKLKFANTLKIADVVRNNITGSEQIHNSAKKVTEKRADGLGIHQFFSSSFYTLFSSSFSFDSNLEIRKHFSLLQNRF